MKRWPRIDHLPSPTNPRLHLCQEWMMRTGAFDDKALVVSWISDSAAVGPFAELVATLGDVDAAIRAVASCAWLAECEMPGQPDGPCQQCKEVRHA